MAGRVRKKLNALFVLYASEPHPIDEMIGFERDLHIAHEIPSNNKLNINVNS